MGFMELDAFRRILDDCAAAHWGVSDARMYLVTCGEDGSPELRELLDPWMIGEAQTRAAEGWQHTIFAVFEPATRSATAVYEWINLPPEKVENCANADDARKPCDEVLERLAEQRRMHSVY
jgi:hypothetical protein